MRVIKEISFADCKASIFYMNQKYIIKFETNSLEQSYKLSELDYIIGDVSDIEKIIEESLYPQSQAIFQAMQKALHVATESIS